MFIAQVKNRLKHNRRLYLLLSPIFGLHRNSVMRRARRRAGIDANKVVFSAFDGRAYSDNPRYISEALHALRPQTDIVWLFRDVPAAQSQYPIPAYVRCHNAIDSGGVSEMATARVLVDNFNKRAYLRFKYPQQVYVQTWHGDRAFKKVGYDNPGMYTYMIEEKCTLGVTGSDYGDRQFRSAFRYRGPLLKVGYPRNDILLRDDPAEAQAIRARLAIDPGMCLLLYAPTFRDVAQHKRQTQRVPLDLGRALSTLERVSGRKWRCLVRAHYMAYGLDYAADARLIDVSAYPEMAELLKIADALITDYSSCAGDFALTRRPIWLYQNDLEDYASHNRALYFDMKDSPYWTAATPEALDALIEATTPERARENCDAILRFYGEAETGHAARSVAEYIAEALDAGVPAK